MLMMVSSLVALAGGRVLLVLALYRGGCSPAIVGDGIERAWDHGGRGDWCRSRPVALSTWLVLVMVDAGGYRWRALAGGVLTGHGVTLNNGMVLVTVVFAGDCWRVVLLLSPCGAR